MSTNRITRKRTNHAEQLRLIQECRSSGMSDSAWCKANGIPHSTFYTWISRCRQAAADQIPDPNYGKRDQIAECQDVVAIRVIDEAPPATPVPAHSEMYLDNSHSIELSIQGINLRISNHTDPQLLAHTLHCLKEFLC